MLNSLWILVCVALVFSMQGGFLCLESGLTRSKDAINVALKNMTDFSISVLLYWAYGFAIMFGVSQTGWFGTTNFLLSIDGNNPLLTTTFLFQAMFCATAATIVSGAVAGRMRFSAYVLTTLIVSGMIYPLFGHWAWGGTDGGPAGWLAAMGFVDFAGSTVVHSVGGWAALAAVLVIGPRFGRFDQESKEPPSSNLPLAMLGALVLWLGWIGFNGGSTLAMNHQVAEIIVNTFLAGAAGMLTALGISSMFLGHADVKQAINGSLAGLVAVTASCHAISTPAALTIGVIGGVVMLISQWTLIRLKIDDAIGVIPVHLAAGAWGTLAVALFADMDILGTGLSRFDQLQVQLLGVLTAFSITFVGTYLLLRIINAFHSLRVSVEQEQVGLNVSEHDAATELHDLIAEMDIQRQTGDFSKRVTVESFSEVGQIAEQYNRVLSVINSERKQLIQSNQRAQAANIKLISAQQSIEQKLQELAEFNEMAVDRELRMIELKQEINSLCEKFGLPKTHNMEFMDATLEYIQ